MDGPLSRLWASSSPTSSSGALRLRLSSVASATAGGNARHSSSEQDEQPKKLRFPLKAACTAGVLAFIGDTAAQLRSRWILHQRTLDQPSDHLQTETVGKKILEDYDWLRALRMTSYGFFIYGPSSQIWYSFLDHILHQKTLRNLSFKVFLNQVVLGPYVIAVVFAWNSLWQGRLDVLPALYADHALSTLVNGWKFWIPASVLNFGVVPLQARVAFMSTCAIFWNFYLSTTMGKA